MRIADFDFPKMKFKENCEYTIRHYSKAEIANKTLQYGDLLIEKSGGGEKTPVGRTVVYRLNNNALFANFMDCIRIKKSIFNFEYAKYVFFALYSIGVTNLYYNQTIGIQNLLVQKYFREVKFPLPPLATQTSIATYLDTKCSQIDGLIADINKQIETLNELKKSTITEAVTKGLNKNAKLKDSGIQWIGMIPEGWRVTKLKYIFDYIRRGQTPNYVEKSNCRVVNQATFSKFYFDREKQKYTANCAYNENFVRKKDVLMASTGGGVLGKVFYYNLDYNDSIADSHVTILRTTNNIESKFYFYTLSILFEWINVNLAEGSTNQTELQRDLLSNSFYPVPPLAEQRDIATYLDTKCTEFDSIISDKQKQISTLEAYKKSLIYEYVTGKNAPPVMIDNLNKN
jgi:type I restriction enzyme S subunit